MATLAELQTIINDGGTKNRVVSALCKTAVNINNEGVEVPNHTNRLVWAKAVLTGDANTVAGQAIKYAIAAYALAHASATPEEITGMDDPTLQSYVDASAAVFAASA